MVLPQLQNSLIDLFLDIFNKRTMLYEDYKQFDKKKISELWKNFTNDLFPSLSDLLKIARTLTSRFVDEYNKDKDAINTDKSREDQIVNNIESLFTFRTELSFLMLTLDIIRNEGIFEIASQPQFIGFTNEVYLELDEITGNFFVEDLPINKLTEIKTMVKLFMDNSLKLRRLILSQIYPELEEDNEKVKLLRAEIDESLGDYIHNYLTTFLSKLGEKWWFYDPLVIHTLFLRGLDYLISSLSFYPPRYRVEKFNHIKRLELYSIPNMELMTKFNLANYYRNLTITAMENSDYQSFEESVKSLLTEIDNGLKVKEKITITDEHKPIFERMEELKLRSVYRREVFILTRLTGDLYLALSENRLDLVDEITKDISSHLNAIDNSFETHISKLTLLFQTVIALSSTATEDTLDYIRARMSKPFEQFQIIILNQAHNKMSKLLSEISDDIDYEIFQSKIRVFQTELELMKQSVCILPDFIPTKLGSIKFIKAAQLFLESLDIAMIPQIKGNLDKLSELAIWTKAHYSAKESYYMVKGLNNNFPIVIDMDMFEKQLVETYEICLDLQNSIYILNIQYMTLNTILRNFFQIITQDPDSYKEKEDRINMIKILDNDDLFIQYVQSLISDSMAIINYNTNTNYKIEVSFNLEKRYHLSKAILHYYSAVKTALIANWNYKMGEVNLAEDMLNAVKDQAFNAAEVARGITISEMKGDLEQHLFSFGQFAQDVIHNLRTEVEFNLPPPQQMFGLLRDLIFAL